MRYFLDPYGCVKNQVDAENMMSSLNASGWSASSAEEADLIIINSCGFIESAKQESINAVLAWRKHYPEKKILLAGCLTQRYEKELKESLCEADCLFGNSDLSGIVASADGTVRKTLTQRRKGAKNNEISSLLNKNFAGFASLRDDKKTSQKQASTGVLYGQRPLLSLPGSAYVKITEGCNNRCSYCAIPLIRGNLRSRQIPEITDEIKTLLKRGIHELCIVGQDIGSFGSDMGKPSLPELLSKLSRIKGEFWIRLLYIHPDHFPFELLEIMKDDRRILPYFDLPFQHGSEKILKLMNRGGNSEKYLELIAAIRGSFPCAVIRSTFLTGFPGESEDDFNALLDFQEKAGLDWLGCFAYSREEDTPAFSMEKQVPKKTAVRRKSIIEERQIPITEKRIDNLIKNLDGRELDVLVEEKVEGEDGLWLGRLFCQAPDVDGSTVINSDKDLKPGALVKCRIISRRGFDLEVRV